MQKEKNFKMKRTLKITTCVIVATIVLLLAGKHEAFLECHFDTLDTRIVKRTSLLGITIYRSSSFLKEGYSAQYRSIYGVDPSVDRWHSVSKNPIIKSTIFSVFYLSVVQPKAVYLRNMMAEDIFKRYLIDHSQQLARDSFTDLEVLLPSTKDLEKLTEKEAQEAYDHSKNLKTLSDFKRPGGYY
jgi:hypothetical protein